METWGSDVNSKFGLFSPKYPYGEIFMAIQPIIIAIIIFIILIVNYYYYLLNNCNQIPYQVQTG